MLPPSSSDSALTIYRKHFSKKQIRTERGLTPGRVVYMKYNDTEPWLSIIIGFGKDEEGKYVIVLQSFPQGDYQLEKEYLSTISIFPYQTVSDGPKWHLNNYATRTQKNGLCASEAEEVYNYFVNNEHKRKLLPFIEIIKDEELNQLSCAETIKKILKKSF